MTPACLRKTSLPLVVGFAARTIKLCLPSFALSAHCAPIFNRLAPSLITPSGRDFVARKFHLLASVHHALGGVF